MWNNARKALMEHMPEKRKLSMTKLQLRDMKVKHAPNESREELLDELTTRKRCIKRDGKYKKHEPIFMPLLHFTTQLADVFGCPNRSRNDLQLQEIYNVDAWEQYLLGFPFRKDKAIILGKIGRVTADEEKKDGRQRAGQNLIKAESCKTKEERSSSQGRAGRRDPLQ